MLGTQVAIMLQGTLFVKWYMYNPSQVGSHVAIIPMCHGTWPQQIRSSRGGVELVQMHTYTGYFSEDQFFISFFSFCCFYSVLFFFLLPLPWIFSSTSLVFHLSLLDLLRQQFLHKKRLPHSHKLIFQKQIKTFPQEEVTLRSQVTCFS